jgi:hypothetical protein
MINTLLTQDKNTFPLGVFPREGIGASFKFLFDFLKENYPEELTEFTVFFILLVFVIYPLIKGLRRLLYRIRNVNDLVGVPKSIKRRKKKRRKMGKRKKGK